MIRNVGTRYRNWKGKETTGYQVATQSDKQITSKDIDPTLPVGEWISKVLPGAYPPAKHHLEFWKWIDNLKRGVLPPAFIAVWPRGGGKSSTCELGAVRIAQKLTRHYLLIVCETQAQADERVEAIRTQLERIGIQAALSKRGTAKGWRRNQLRTANGFNVAGFGLDRGIRGTKLDEFRPDWIHFDDIDSSEDTTNTTNKKERTITRTILKAGSTDLAVSFAQNVIIPDGIMGRLISGKAKYLARRKISGPIPAIIGLEYKQNITEEGEFQYEITAGTPTWEGQGIAECEHSMNLTGPESFIRESQHELDEGSGGLWEDIAIRYVDDENFPIDLSLAETGWPELRAVAIVVDPSGSDRGDEVGIMAVGKFRLPSGVDRGIVLEDMSGRKSPAEWIRDAVYLYRKWKPHTSRIQLLAETNFGGEIVNQAFKTVPNSPPVRQVVCSQGKKLRAAPVVGMYERGEVWHLIKLYDCERQMRSWHPGKSTFSPGRIDALVIGLTHLLIPDPKGMKVMSVSPAGSTSAVKRKSAVASIAASSGLTQISRSRFGRRRYR